MKTPPASGAQRTMCVPRCYSLDMRFPYHHGVLSLVLACAAAVQAVDCRRAGGSRSSWARPVVKAFNNIYARHLLELGRPAGRAGRIALPVAGDDASAKAVVLKLVDELGFDGVDAGGLDKSWRQQPGTPVYAKDFDAEGVWRALSEAKKERTLEWRGTENSPGSFAAPA